MFSEQVLCMEPWAREDHGSYGWAEGTDVMCMLAAPGSIPFTLSRLICIPTSPHFLPPAQPSLDTRITLVHLSPSSSNRNLRSKVKLFSTFAPPPSSPSQQQLYSPIPLSLIPQNWIGIFFISFGINIQDLTTSIHLQHCPRLTEHPLSPGSLPGPPFSSMTSLVYSQHSSQCDPEKGHLLLTTYEWLPVSLWRPKSINVCKALYNWSPSNGYDIVILLIAYCLSGYKLGKGVIYWHIVGTL